PDPGRDRERLESVPVSLPPERNGRMAASSDSETSSFTKELAMTRHLWIGGVRLIALATLAHAGTTAAQSELAREGTARSAQLDPLALSLGNSCPSAWLPTFGGPPGT